MNTESATTDTIFCPNCSVEISAAADTCPHCHAAIGELATSEEPKRDSLFKYLDRPAIMLAMLFFVTAGLGLPFLWKSRAFGMIGKTVLTLIMIAYTGLILWAIYLLIVNMMHQFQELGRTW